jgi:hypothetical protein
MSRPSSPDPRDGFLTESLAPELLARAVLGQVEHVGPAEPHRETVLVLAELEAAIVERDVPQLTANLDETANAAARSEQLRGYRGRELDAEE